MKPRKIYPVLCFLGGVFVRIQAVLEQSGKELCDRSNQPASSAGGAYSRGFAWLADFPVYKGEKAPEGLTPLPSCARI